MTVWDSFVVVDWSGGNDTGAKPRKDAIWAGAVLGGVEQEPVYLRNREVAYAWLCDLIRAERALGRRVMIGFDFPFGYPMGFAGALVGRADPLALWDWFAAHLTDSPDGNNRFELAGQINAMWPGVGPFWFNPTQADIAHLPRKGRERTRDHGLKDRRRVEAHAKGSLTCWQMGGAGAVGGQVMTGMAFLSRLRAAFRDELRVWPFQSLAKPVALVEVWPSLLAAEVAAQDDAIKDRAQVRLLARALSRLAGDDLGRMLSVDEPEEGWILGVGHEQALADALTGGLQPPRLKNDCFALPPGVDWTPVDEALSRLRANLRPIARIETVMCSDALGRVLAVDAKAQRANPPGANSAVDGYGFAQSATGSGDQLLPLIKERAAAGAAFEGEVPHGSAIRILTGALLPKGVDTVVLEEDTTSNGFEIAFEGPIKPGANTRKAGEDVEAAAVAVRAGTRLGPSQLALLAATGVREVATFTPLRVGVLSTGDEIVAPGSTPDPARTYDANRPMLLALLDDWRMEAVDLGHVGDDRAKLTALLDAAAQKVDVILTSGGASAGDEDHVSAALGEAGVRHDWRIALKPGRPLALGMWQSTPVFALPGNPVAALVCTLIFARPALALMGGESWSEPQGFMVAAAFSKTKKPGRREYMRARMTDGAVDVFHSEGSGRISGLAWAEGLVELGDGAQIIRPGDLVRYIPYESFRA
ncbi:molybdopterin-binding protein [Boseongicola aestuarii]|uniref:Molybdopterin molybdenumtransferase n=1 Tax=Boseongicola aestuarii TaxID=1470561 RepID=A0A238J1Y4_9RHOB|nr:gephyrin-like molybdotransferase Glp [Boseongicola aestuarii]SMX24676.1 Molybdopterin molybdenumtransferase [Boseongicola aestuarii]